MTIPPQSSGPNSPSGGAGFTPKRFGLILGVFLLSVFPKIFLGLHSFFYRDYGVLAYPCAFYQHQSFWRGEFPLWNPLSHCGVPFLAQWGTNLYPLSLIYLIFPLPWSLSYFCLLHLFLAGLGMYFLAHRWVGNRFAASLAGTAYVFNGVTFSCLLWPNYIAALSWTPWAVLCVERSWREGGRWMVAGAVVSAMQMLTGVPEIILLTWLLLGTLWLDELWRAGTARRLLVVRMLAVVLLVAGLAAAQLLPFFDLLAHSQRDRSFGTAKWAMPVWGWANLLVPRFRCYETSQGIWFQETQEFLTTYYLGAGMLVLAVWGVWRAGPRRVWLLAGLICFCLVMAMGESGFLFGWLKRFLPLMGFGRYPVKFVLLVAFLVPLLAAWGVAQLEVPTADSRPARRSFYAFGAMALVGMAVLWCFMPRDALDPDQRTAIGVNTAARAMFLVVLFAALGLWPRIGIGPRRMSIQLGILVLVAADVATYMLKQVPSTPVAELAPGLWQEQQPMPPPKVGQSRVMITPQAEKRLLRTGTADHGQDFIGRRLAEWSNLNLLDNVPKVNGAATLQVREQKELESLLYAQTNGLPQGLLDFLAVEWITSPASAVAWISRTNSCPWVTCGQKPSFADGSNVLQALIAPDFDPRQTVYLPRACQEQVAVTNQTRCRIVASRFSPQRVELDVEALEPSLVVIAQTFYLSWRARIDGQPTALLRANHAFQALQVPAGRHQVVVSYSDPYLRWGGLISGITVLLGALWWFVARRSDIRSGKEANPAGIAA